jgi:hypothetical protein
MDYLQGESLTEHKCQFYAIHYAEYAANIYYTMQRIVYSRHQLTA